MMRCIYSGADETIGSFQSAEHVFPKCIGGVRCLPKGWVADSVNNAFSKLELAFARENPSVSVSRMFFRQTGRKKHRNKARIGVFQNINGACDYALGYIDWAKPIPLSQIVLSADITDAGEQGVPVKIIMAPSASLTHERQLHLFWEKLRQYTGSPVCMKDDRLPPHTYLLGEKDGRWFLGISKKENPETVKPKLTAFIRRLASEDVSAMLSGDAQIETRTHRVEAEFSFAFDYLDVLRVYAKIAFNCLAALKGQELVLSEAFDDIRNAILTGENIDRLAWPANGPNPVSESLRSFPDRLPLGARSHITAFMQKENILYGIVSLYGMDNPIIVRLGAVPERVHVDFYVCDWENQTDYTMTDCVLKICGHEREQVPFGS